MHTYQPLSTRRRHASPLVGCPAEIVSGPTPSVILDGEGIYEVRVTGPNDVVTIRCYGSELIPSPTAQEGTAA